jgi:hypothetical protein
MVAIIVTMIMMFVITLIVLGFSEVTRRNQRESLDTQLGTQAYYAAETGVNDVVTSVSQGLTPNTTSCATFNAKSATGATVQLPRQLKADNSIANTCLLVDSNPTYLLADSIAPSTGSAQWHVKSLSGGPFTKLTFTWSPYSATAVGPCNSAFKSYPPATGWACTHALLRVDLLNTNAIVSYDANSLANATRTLYLQPYSGATTNITLGGPSAYQGSCKPTGGLCTVAINTSAIPSGDYYVRITSMYATATDVILRPYQGVAGTTPARLTDGQIVVDSTGRAQDQVKRIRVRIPIGSKDTPAPIFAVQGTDSICKNLTVLAPSTYDEACNWP